MKQTFNVGILLFTLGVMPLMIYRIGLELGLFEGGLEMLFGILAYACFPATVILFIIGTIQYFKTKRNLNFKI